MIRIGQFLMVSKFMVSRALSAVERRLKYRTKDSHPQSILTISWLLIVDIRIAKGAASHYITANTSRQNRT